MTKLARADYHPKALLVSKRTPGVCVKRDTERETDREKGKRGREGGEGGGGGDGATRVADYGVATMSRLLSQFIGLFCRIPSL